MRQADHQPVYPGEERSFTIIAYPTPQIGEQFEDIFRETAKINTLDYNLYQRIQQRIIDALDQGVKVQIRGRGENRTDLRISLRPLGHPERETRFENCVADVNIPVGEVFTSPVLQGTEGNAVCGKCLYRRFSVQKPLHSF